MHDVVAVNWCERRAIVSTSCIGVNVVSLVLTSCVFGVSVVLSVSALCCGMYAVCAPCLESDFWSMETEAEGMFAEQKKSMRGLVVEARF